MQQAERDEGQRAGPTSDDKARIRELEREVPGTAAGKRDAAAGQHVFRPSGARSSTQAMTGLINDHREAYGVKPICRLLRIVPSTYCEARCPTPRSLFAASSRATRREATRPRASRVQCELRCLRRAQGLAAYEPRGDQRGPLHSRKTDAGDGPARRPKRKASSDDRSRLGRTVPARQGQFSVLGTEPHRAYSQRPCLRSHLEWVRSRSLRN